MTSCFRTVPGPYMVCHLNIPKRREHNGVDANQILPNYMDQKCTACTAARCGRSLASAIALVVVVVCEQDISKKLRADFREIWETGPLRTRCDEILVRIVIMDAVT